MRVRCHSIVVTLAHCLLFVIISNSWEPLDVDLEVVLFKNVEFSKYINTSAWLPLGAQRTSPLYSKHQSAKNRICSTHPR